MVTTTNDARSVLIVWSMTLGICMLGIGLGVGLDKWWITGVCAVIGIIAYYFVHAAFHKLPEVDY